MAIVVYIRKEPVFGLAIYHAKKLMVPRIKRGGSLPVGLTVKNDITHHI
jgi:hypothetical protein